MSSICPILRKKIWKDDFENDGAIVLIQEVIGAIADIATMNKPK
jgi:hypothetical protein